MEQGDESDLKTLHPALSISGDEVRDPGTVIAARQIEWLQYIDGEILNFPLGQSRDGVTRWQEIHNI